jgi:cell division control protein 6
VEAIRTLPTQSKLVLLAVVSRDRRGSTPSSTGEVYNPYERLCAGAPVDPLSQRRVPDLLDELDTFGLVSADVVSEGRYGRTRRIEGAVAPAPTRDVLLADDHIGDVSVPNLGVGSDD